MKKFELWYPIDIKPFIVAQTFGENLLPIYQQYGMKGHNGWDIVCETGTPLRAAHDGVVTYLGLDSTNGWLIELTTDDKREYKGKEVYFKTLYGHLKPGTFRVKAGDKIRVGTVMCETDNTGASTNPHLHFGLKPVDGNHKNIEQGNGYNGAIDPAPFWNGKHAKEAYGLYQIIDSLKELLASLTKKS